jgi:hypothetical protein
MTLNILGNQPRLPIYRRVGILVGAILLCLALLVGIARAQSPSACLDRFLVRPGDSLTGIANIYGFDWKVIAELNDLRSPYDLYAGQWLCLPAKVGAEAAAKTPHPSRAPRWTVRISANRVEIQSFNFPAKNAYVVKASDSQAPADEPGYKLGTLRTKKGGDLLARFSLPEELRETAQIEICLKNATSDELTCHVTSNRR